MCLGFGRKPEHPKVAHAENSQTPHRAASITGPSCCETMVLTTKPPHHHPLVNISHTHVSQSLCSLYSELRVCLFPRREQQSFSLPILQINSTPSFYTAPGLICIGLNTKSMKEVCVTAGQFSPPYYVQSSHAWDTNQT